MTTAEKIERGARSLADIKARDAAYRNDGGVWLLDTANDITYLLDLNAELVEALEKCLATFEDLARVLSVVGKPILAEACTVAANGTREALVSAQS